MNQKFRFSLITAAVLMVFVLSATLTIPAFADDEVPPPTEPPITETDPTPLAPDTVTEPTTDSTSVEEPAPISELLEQLPEGTTVVITDSEGEPLPLATEEAAQVMASGDPMWCPVGVTPGGAGCTTPGQTSFAAMLAELSLQNTGTGPNKAGVIWIEDDYDSSVGDPVSTSFTLNGATLTTMAKYALTIQGGWTGSGKTIDQFNPSEFNASLSILNWLAPITINDIIITGATVNPNPGTNGALQVETTKNITVNRVQSNENNNLWGAVLDNGIGNPGIYPIIINDSAFNGNSGDGLHVFSNGAITVRNVTANFNGIDDANLEYGAFLTNWLNIDANQPVTLNGTNEFKGNLGTGLFVSSFGVVTLNNITATGNDDGTDSVNNDAQGVLIDASLSVRMTGTNLINYNQTNGLNISSDGTITLNNITASNNGDNGALLDNCLNPANAVCPTVAKAVTLTGSNTFNWNGNYGLHVESSGVIKISQVTAVHNTTGGVFLDNCAYDSVTLLACLTPLPYAITITSPSTFLYNGFDGLYIRTTGAVSLKSITSSFNDNRGVTIDNHASLLKPQNVTLSGTNIINGNDNFGLVVTSYGAVTLSNITSNDNGKTDSNGYGVFVDNRAYNGTLLGSVLVARKPVTFTGNNTFNNNYSGGLFIYSVGDVTLSNITAIGNGLTPLGDGVHIENEIAWYPNGVTQTAYAANVTLNGFGLFEGNGDEGLQIFSRGAIKLNNVTANDNADVGVWANNAFVNTISARQPITLAGTNNFNDNDGGGLMLLSFGAVTLSNITAMGNLPTGATGVGDGVSIQNDLAWSPNGVLTSYAANVTISGYGYFEGNTDDGLDILSKGIVTLATIAANSNGDDGAVIFTKGDLLPQNVTLNGSNNFYGNGFTSTNGNGLFIQSDGKITINNLSAIGNRANGAWLDNFTDKKLNKFLGVTLTGFNNFQKNQGTNGLFIHSDGSVLLYHVTADDNSGNGINVVATKNITISCGSAFSNFGTGFFLNAGAILTLKGVHAYGNGADEILTPAVPIRTFACP